MGGTNSGGSLAPARGSAGGGSRRRLAGPVRPNPCRPVHRSPTRATRTDPPVLTPHEAHPGEGPAWGSTRAVNRSTASTVTADAHGWQGRARLTTVRLQRSEGPERRPSPPRRGRRVANASAGAVSPLGHPVSPVSPEIGNSLAGMGGRALCPYGQPPGEGPKGGGGGPPICKRGRLERGQGVTPAPSAVTPVTSGPALSGFREPAAFHGVDPIQARGTRCTQGGVRPSGPGVRCVRSGTAGLRWRRGTAPRRVVFGCSVPCSGCSVCKVRI